MNVLLGLLAIGIGVAVIAARERFLRSGEASRAAFYNKPENAGHPGFRRAFSRGVVVLSGAIFIVLGLLNAAGVIQWVQ